jgi:serine/threonine protein kinase
VAEFIGRYRILRPLGEGGMGRLFLGEVAGASGFSRRVVVKVVKDELDAGLKQALLDEARLVASLVHRNIVPVLDLEESGEQRVVIMEHVDGMDVRQLLERRKKLPWPIAAFIASEVVAGLDYAHRKTDSAGRPLAIVHRDVSPANILLSWEGEVKLTDFGVAKFARSGDGSLGGLKGNLGYMAPEQARGDFVDPRADLFAAGVVLYEMLTGKNPFRSRSDLLTLAQLREGKVPKLPLDMPEPLQELLSTATAPDARERFSSAAAMREALVNLPGQPADPARQLAQFLSESRGAPTVQADALLEAVLGGGRPVTVQRPLDTVEDLLPPSAPVPIVEPPAPRPSRVRLMLIGVAVALSIAALFEVGLLVLRAFSRPPAPVAEGTPPEKPGEPAVEKPVEKPVEKKLAPEAVDVKPRPPRRGSLSVNAIPWAKIYLDGRSLGHTPRMNLPVDAGKHSLKLVTSRGDTRTRAIEVASGKETRVTINFAQP